METRCISIVREYFSQRSQNLFPVRGWKRNVLDDYYFFTLPFTDPIPRKGMETYYLLGQYLRLFDFLRLNSP